MFTGIVEKLGSIQNLRVEKENLHITVSCDFTSELQVDQSVSHNGVCLTVVALEGDNYTVTAIKETLEKTNVGTWKVGDAGELGKGHEIGCPPRRTYRTRTCGPNGLLYPYRKRKWQLGLFVCLRGFSEKCDHRKRVHHHQRYELDCREFEKKRVQCGHHSLHLRTHELSPFSNRYRGQFGI